jgi:putative transposase
MHLSPYRRAAGAVYNLHYHFVWCPTYRRPALTGARETRPKDLLAEKAATMDTQVEVLEVMPNYVHLFVSVPPTDAPPHLAHQFKGYPSRVLRQECPHLRSRLPTLRSRPYYVGSAG